MGIYSGKRIKVLYEGFMMFLAVVAVTLAFLDLAGKVSIESSGTLESIDSAILYVFIFDYFARLFMAKDKKQFIMNNKLDLIAIIPFNAMFKVLRVSKMFRAFKIAKIAKVTKFLKFVRILRLVVFTRKIMNKTNIFLKINGFIYMVYITAGTIVLGAVGIYLVENGQTVDNFGDAVWWSFVTTTTVGYGDISPVTILGRIIASILMLIGIGFIGMLTGTIATYFMNGNKIEKTENNLEQVVDLSDLNEQSYREVLAYVDFVRSRE